MIYINCLKRHWITLLFLKIVVQGKGHMGNRVAFVFVEVNMAEKKPTKKTTKKTKKVTYKDKKFAVMEEVNGRLKLTDGIIHFWVKADKVERN